MVAAAFNNGAGVSMAGVSLGVVWGARSVVIETAVLGVRVILVPLFVLVLLIFSV